MAAKRGFIDDIIDPQNTRKILCRDLNVLRTKDLPNIPRKHTNMPL
jgi:propionyl-CoA carboxylase beta chain